jgi:hypothetical protein
VLRGFIHYLGPTLQVVPDSKTRASRNLEDKILYLNVQTLKH